MLINVFFHDGHGIVSICVTCIVSIIWKPTFCHTSLLPHPDTALTSLPDKEPFKDKAVSTVATAEKDVPPPLGGVVTTEKDSLMDSKAVQDNLTEDKDMELLDDHEEDPHSESKEKALIRLQNFI